MAMVRVSAMTLARFVRMLLDGPQTAREIAAETGLHPVTVARYLREMRRVHAVGICAWEKDSRGRDAIRVYELGRTKRDAPRTRKTEAQVRADYKARLREKRLHRMLAGTTAP